MSGQPSGPDASADPMQSSERFVDLDRAERSRLIRRSAFRSAAAVVLVVAAYAILPLHHLIDGRTDSWGYVRAAVAVALAVLVLAVQMRAVMTARFPQLRVLEGFALVIPATLVVFATIYISLSETDAGAFSEPLGKIGAIYFSLTTMTTVGFGDIHPLSDVARVMVMVQMIVTFGVLGVAGRVVYGAVQRRLDADQL